jgi:hypothetical protein
MGGCLCVRTSASLRLLPAGSCVARRGGCWCLLPQPASFSSTFMRLYAFYLLLLLRRLPCLAVRGARAVVRSGRQAGWTFRRRAWTTRAFRLFITAPLLFDLTATRLYAGAPQLVCAFPASPRAFYPSRVTDISAAVVEKRRNERARAFAYLWNAAGAMPAATAVRATFFAAGGGLTALAS